MLVKKCSRSVFFFAKNGKISTFLARPLSKQIYSSNKFWMQATLNRGMSWNAGKCFPTQFAIMNSM